jgi:hypothetical protein
VSQNRASSSTESLSGIFRGFVAFAIEINVRASSGILLRRWS